MRLLVLSSCTAKKSVSDPGALTYADLADPARRAERLAVLASLAVPATQLYTGMHHVHVAAGVEALRAAPTAPTVSLKIISAGFGLVDEADRLPPYECTFSGMKRAQAAAWARTLGIAKAVRLACSGADVVLWLLGSEYLAAVGEPLRPADGQRFVFLVKPSEAKRLAAPGATVLPLDSGAPGRYGAGNVALKGKMFRLFALAAAADPGVLGAVTSDDSPATFVDAVSHGLSLFRRR